MKLISIIFATMTCTSLALADHHEGGYYRAHPVVVEKCGVANYLFRHSVTCSTTTTATDTQKKETTEPAKVAPQAIARLVDNKIEIAQQITFKTGSATITPEGKKILDEVAMVIESNQDKVKSVAIDGHTDHVGKPESNLKLSERRAQAVKTYLISKGVAESKLTAKGYGMSQPKYEVGKATAEELAQNRRVEFTVQ